MYTIASMTDYPGLAAVLRSAYALEVLQIRTHRDFIGHVHHVQCRDRACMLKVYRPFHTQNALNTVGVLRYLAQRRYPAVPVIDTAAGEATITIRTPAGDSIAMLYPFIVGEEPDRDAELEAIADNMDELHRVMAAYTGDIDGHGKAFYIDRYLALLERSAVPPSQLADLRAYGDRLWTQFDGSVSGFCHGDYHCGNMLRDTEGTLWLLDFDAACRAHPTADIATLCDGTDYFHLRAPDFDQTARTLNRFLPRYEKANETTLHDADIRSVYAFIAVRHFDIQATIAACQGTSMQILENQYRWLMGWQALCDGRLR